MKSNVPSEYTRAAAAESNSGTDRSIAFRPDVEGLRGVAILLVLAFHFGLPSVTGGYIGVDVFYVISGFLICSILRKRDPRNFSDLVSFYGRRVQRLMPAYILLLAVLTVACFAIMLPEDLLRYLVSARETLLFRANRYFNRELATYFAPAASELPLLHTWSLSIEWQFYLLFPIALAALKLLVAPKWLPETLVVVVGILFGLSWYLTAAYGNVYFHAIPRAFEFVLGAMIAVFPAVHLSRRAAEGVSLVALLVLGYLSTFLTPQSAFPGLNALIVSAAAAIAIRYGRGSWILGNRALTTIGQRSYSLYLWHWPVLALAAYTQSRNGLSSTVLLFGLVVALSEVSYRLVERPIMGRRVAPWKAIAFAGLTPLVATVAVLHVTRSEEGFPQRLGPLYFKSFSNVRAADTLPRGCDEFSGAVNALRCSLGASGASDKALLIGDSHARHFASFVDLLSKDVGLTTYGLFNGECLSLEGAIYERGGRPNLECQEATKAYYSMIRAGKFKYVFLGQRWVGYPVSQLELLESSVDTIIRSGAIPVILKPIAENGTNMKDCYNRHFKIRTEYGGECKMDQTNEYLQDKKRYVSDLIARVQRRFPEALVIDPQLVQCVEKNCVVEVDGTPIYSDLHHVNDFGSRWLGRAYMAKFGNPLGASIR